MNNQTFSFKQSYITVDGKQKLVLSHSVLNLFLLAITTQDKMFAIHTETHNYLVQIKEIRNPEKSTDTSLYFKGSGIIKGVDNERELEMEGWIEF